MRTCIALISAFALLACGESTTDDSDTQGGSTSSATTTDVTTTSTTDASTGEDMEFPPGDTAGVGETCYFNDDCVSWYCRKFSDVPVDPDASCADNPGWGVMISTGNIRNIRTNEPIGNVPIRVISALGAVANPLIAETLAEGMADASGRFEITSTTTNGTSIGIVAAVEQEGFFLTLTALASPEGESTDYLPSNSIHDVWAVPASDLTDWSAMLAGDDRLAEFLPLGEKGGTVGVVRDEATGGPLAAATVVSEDGLETNSYILYLNEEQDGFNEEATATSGVFLILNADLAEEFEGFVGEDRIGSIVTGSADSSILAGSID
jgi:hypothetical protein